MEENDTFKDLFGKLSEESSGEDEDERILELHKNYTGSDELVSAEQFKKDCKEDTALYKVGSNIKELDRMVEGFRPGTVVVISGPTKQGKTTFCQTLTSHFTKSNYPCLWFSFDTPPIEVINRFPELPVFYLPKKNKPEKKLDWIEAKIIEGIAKYNTRMVFIDHLGFLTKYADKSNNYATELTSIVRELKAISIRWNVTIFLNHHIRGIPNDVLPDWTHLKDSAGIAQECDMVIMIWREKKKTDAGIEFADSAQISLQLHRRTGMIGNFKVGFKDNAFIDYEEIRRKKTLISTDTKPKLKDDNNVDDIPM